MRKRERERQGRSEEEREREKEKERERELSSVSFLLFGCVICETSVIGLTLVTDCPSVCSLL